MKIFFALLITFLSLNASQKDYELESFSYVMENDAIVYTDFGYTHGARISLLFSTPLTIFDNTNNFLSLSYANQMYTPNDLDKVYRIENDRPYAGYSYIELGLHQSANETLNSLTLELGKVGPSTDMDLLQKTIHNLIGTKHVCGWEYQIEDEYIYQLNYLRKHRIKNKDFYGYENDLIYSYGINLGNKSLKASGALLYRIGRNITDDFGISSMNEANYSSVPSKPNAKTNSDYSFFFNFSAGFNLIEKDIFLDGDTNNHTHYIDKKPFTAFVMGGFTYRHEEYRIDFFHNYYTKDYEQRDNFSTYKGFSSLILTYDF